MPSRSAAPGHRDNRATLTPPSGDPPPPTTGTCPPICSTRLPAPAASLPLTPQLVTRTHNHRPSGGFATVHIHVTYPKGHLRSLAPSLPRKSTPRLTHRARLVFSTQGHREDNLSQVSTTPSGPVTAHPRLVGLCLSASSLLKGAPSHPGFCPPHHGDIWPPPRHCSRPEGAGGHELPRRHLQAKAKVALLLATPTMGPEPWRFGFSSATACLAPAPTRPLVSTRHLESRQGEPHVQTTTSWAEKGAKACRACHGPQPGTPTKSRVLRSRDQKRPTRPKPCPATRRLEHAPGDPALTGSHTQATTGCATDLKAPWSGHVPFRPAPTRQCGQVDPSATRLTAPVSHNVVDLSSMRTTV